MSPTRSLVAPVEVSAAGRAHRGARSKRKPDEIDFFIAQQLKRCRERSGLSQMELAAQLGVSHQQYQKYESGQNRVSGSVIIRSALLLNVSPNEFLPTASGREQAVEPKAASLGGGRTRDTETQEFSELCSRVVNLTSPRLRIALAALLEQLIEEDKVAIR